MRDVEWVHQSDWLLRSSFNFAGSSGDVFLEFDGIDTFADIWLNGHRIGATANAYRSYRFAVPRDLLVTGENTLLLHVKAHARMVKHLVPEAERRLGATYKLKGLIRRYQRNFFSGSSLLNLGGEVLGIGIYKPARLVVRPPARIENVHFEVHEAVPVRGAALAHVELNPDAVDASRTVRVALHDDDGRCVAEAIAPAATDRVSLPVTVEKPKLWWPRGYGEPSRYLLSVELRDGEVPLDRSTCHVGFRTVRLSTTTATGRNTFQLVVNGTPVSVRGQNLVPVDHIKVHGAPDIYDRLLRMVCEGNANLIRI